MKKLRLGIVVGSARIDGWQRFALEKILDDPRFELILAIENGNLKPCNAGRRKGFHLWPLINAYENRLTKFLYTRVFKHKLSLKDQPGDLREMAKAANWLTVDRPDSHDDGACEFTKKDVAMIAASDIDILVNLSASPIKGEVLSTARYGCWEFRYGQNNPESSVTPGFWEIYNKEPVCRIDLVSRNAPQSATEIIKSGIYRTFYWSWNENARKLKYRSSWLLIDSLKAFASAIENSDAADNFMLTQGEILSANVALKGEPSAVQSLSTVTSYFTRLAWEKARRYLYNDKWSLFVGEGTSANATWSASRQIEPPDECYWADPFLIKRDGKHYIFFEEYGFVQRKGFISYIELPSPLDQNQLKNLTSKPVIDNDYHMSYPFLLEHEGELYMVPESSQNKTISLWKCDQFPDTWTRQKDLIKDISAVDSTLVNWNGKWWMFTNVDRTGAGEHYTELHIYHSDDPIKGNWTAHTQNPVVTDVTRARMAGNFIKLPDGKLIRCNQVIKTYYGEAIGMQEVVKLSETEYEETPHKKIEANWRKDIYRNHHTDSRDGLAVIDACRHVFKLKFPLFRL